MPGQKGMGSVKPGQGMVTVEETRFGRPSDLTIRMETGRCLDHNPRIAGVLSISCCRVFSGDSAGRHRAPVGDPLNDEQWSDHLLNPSSR